MDQILQWSAQAIFMLFLLVAFIVIIAASIYDIKMINGRKLRQQARKKFATGEKPLVTILLYVNSNIASIMMALNSIKRNRYSRYEVMVIDNASGFSARQVVSAYNKRFPRFNLKLYSRHSKARRLEALWQAYQKSTKGDLVLVLDSTNTIPPLFIRDGVSRFIADNQLSVSAVRFNINYVGSESVLALYYRFQQVSDQMLTKFYSAFSQYRIRLYKAGTLYSRTVWMEALNQRMVSGKYESELSITDYMPEDHSLLPRLFKRNKDGWGWFGKILTELVAFSAVLLQTYSIYIAAVHLSPFLLIAEWLSVILWLLITAWSSQSLSPHQKMELTFISPIVYFMIYAHAVSYLIYWLVKVFSKLTKDAADYLKSTSTSNNH